MAASHHIPESMKAAAIDRFGPPSVLRLHQLPVPNPGPREVLIALDTAGVGSWDASIRDGSWRKPGRPRFPLIPGTDGAGIVVAKGARVRRFRLGEAVYAYEFGNRQGGFYAEFAVANDDHVARVPKAVDLSNAGSRGHHGPNGASRGQRTRLAPGTDRPDLWRIWRGGHDGRAVRRAPRGVRDRHGVSKAAAAMVLLLGAKRVIDARREDAIEQLRALTRHGEGLDGVLALAGGAGGDWPRPADARGLAGTDPCPPPNWRRTCAPRIATG
jgi:NADPH2:quinone reductase